MRTYVRSGGKSKIKIKKGSALNVCVMMDENCEYGIKLYIYVRSCHDLSSTKQNNAALYI